jgi:2,3-bisphosphoglycerate-independent phosphoglycerate mutase
MTGDHPVVLVIIDGWGYREEKTHNALTPENAPYFFSLWNTYPHALLDASGEAVGLPKGQIGTSELGHMIIGSGRVDDTALVQITKAFENGELARNARFIEMCNQVKKNASTLHVLGLASPGGVHSHQAHLFEFLKAAKRAGVEKISVHAFTDGRDMPPKSAHRFLKEIEDFLAELGTGSLASVSGRFYAMDRDTNWQRTQRVVDMLFKGDAPVRESPASKQLKKMYSKGVVDEHAEPFIVGIEVHGKPLIRDNDAVFFFNFRPDRMRQITRASVEQKLATNLYVLTMTEYDASLPCHVLFPPPPRSSTLSDVISGAGLAQAHIAETEKYAHVTYFFNGKRETPNPGEEFVLITSRRDVPTHDLAPEMRASEITDAGLLEAEKGKDFILINYANADLVGHTAHPDAIIAAVRCIDRELKRLVEGVAQAGGVVLITSDHGNVEVNVDAESGEKHTAHTLNPVPAVLTDANVLFRSSGTLADVAPTVLELLGLAQPQDMTGRSLRLRL